MGTDDRLEQALASVRERPSFAALSRGALLTTERLTDALRAADPGDLHAVRRDLEVIADGGDDPNEGTGFLAFTLAFAPEPHAPEPEPDRWGLATTDPQAFAAAAIAVPPEQRADGAAWFWSTGAKRVRRVGADAVAERAHRHIIQVVEVGLDDAGELARGLEPFEELRVQDVLEHQIHPELWDVLQSRGEREAAEVVTRWWGQGSHACPHLLVLLEWVRAGHVAVPDSDPYREACVALLVHAEPGLAPGQRALDRYPWLGADALAGLRTPGGFAWLHQELDPTVAALEALIGFGASDRPGLVSVLDDGLARGWGGPREARERIGQIRERVAA